MVNQSKRNTFDTSCLSASNLRILLAIATSKSFSGASDKLNSIGNLTEYVPLRGKYWALHFYK